MTRIHLMAGALGALFLLLGASLQDPTPAAEELWVCPPCSPDCHDTRYPEPGKCNGCGMALVEASSIATVAVLVFEGCDLPGAWGWEPSPRPTAA